MIAFAGALRGAGNAAEKGLSNFQSALTTKMLQEGSQDFAREQADTAYTRARFNIDDERKYTAKREAELYALGRGRKAAEAEEDLSTREKVAGKKGAVEEQEFDAGAKVRKKQGDEKIDLDRRTGEMETDNEIRKGIALAENKSWLKAQMILANAKESSHSRALAAKTMYDLEQGKEGAKIRDEYVRLVADPNADPAKLQQARQAWSAYSMKPGESEKIDATNAAAGMREAGNEIVRLQGMLKDQIPGTPEHAALERRLSNAEAAHDAFTQRVKELTGTKDKPKTKVVIKDRFKPENTDVARADEQEAADITRQNLEKETQPKKPTGMIHSNRRFEFDRK